MRDELIGRVLRALRHRKGWRQQDLTDRSGIGQSVISDLEAGRLGRHALDALREAVAAVDGVVRISVQVPGSDMNRLLDADHAQLQEHRKRWLERHGWTVHAEVTFNHFGERGSIDLLAWHAVTATLLVIPPSSVAGMGR